MNQRKGNFECLRIISTLMIIVLHFLGHGGVIGSYSEPTVLWGICELIKGLCMVAVNCFVLISGYFSVDSTFKWNKIIRLIVQILFYSVVIFAVLYLTTDVEFGIKDLFSVFFPLSTNTDGFSSVYIILYMFSPYLNEMIIGMSQKKYRNLMITLILVFVILPNIFWFMDTTVEFGGGYGIVWFVVLYFTGGYIRRFGNERINLRKRCAIYVISALLVPLSCYAIVLCHEITGVDKIWNFKELFYYYNSILVYFASVALFGLFQKIQFSGRAADRIVSFFAPATFGVFLIHDNKFLRDWLWDLLNPSIYVNSAFLLIYMVCCIGGIFLLCVMIEKVRIWLFNLFLNGRKCKNSKEKKI